eukprot:TRINITY_DN92576_c0_g1_i1.p1 TRINITY_DN92576_c0_g1~~TRINITY_DN92576_c0_g1_i1.p1  ORF type:complete len:371 (-),score=38.35 TRINITY_DN92576_c0_g1_i1:8-1120(-)
MGCSRVRACRCQRVPCDCSVLLGFLLGWLLAGPSQPSWSQCHKLFMTRVHRFECFAMSDHAPKKHPAGPALVHTAYTAQAWHLSDSIPPLRWVKGRAFHCAVGSIPLAIQSKMRRLVRKGRKHWPQSSRPTHKGELNGVGFKLSANMQFSGTRELADDVNDILRGMLNTRLLWMINKSDRMNAWQGFPNYISPALPAAEPGVATEDLSGGVLNAYVGLSYMHVRAPVRRDHAPPPAVAALLGVPSCRQSCKRCMKPGGCIDCEDCCLHVDNDHSASLLLGLQEANPAANQRAFFVLGEKAFPLEGGRAFVFDGAMVPHGVWCMHGKYTGMAFVKKMPDYFNPSLASLTTWILPDRSSYGSFSFVWGSLWR